MADSDAGGKTPTQDSAAVPVAPAEKPYGVPPTLVSFAGIMWRVIVIGFAIYVILLMLGKIAPIMVAIFMALLLTALALPLARLLERFLPSAASVILALVAIASVGTFILYQVIKSIASEGDALSAAVKEGITQIDDWLQQGPLSLTGDQLKSVHDTTDKWVHNAAVDVLNAAASELSSLGTFFMAAAVFLFSAFFFMASGPTIWSWIVSWAPTRARAAFNISGDLAWVSLAGYTRGMVVVAIADATLVFIGLLILQVPLAAALAAVVFMGAFIPMIGAPIATLLAAVVALATRGVGIAILVIILTVIVGSFDGDVMQPLVMGKAVSLSPLAIIIVISAGAISFGIIGALVAVPIVSSIYSVMKFLTNRDPEHPFPPEPPPEPTSEPVPTEAAAK